ncbi:hypothetical protein [Nocardia vermiculata]|uniref:Uncharacterized protein n=1 Tax=Nocardia vermiculata TaxID=257274 RepID=A0A846Y656_9NOCA|nr:hypothetical protein [Nocardia vermiculata]NKY53805.1 hypothetical protein [Nocardia vermiculata]
MSSVRAEPERATALIARAEYSDTPRRLRLLCSGALLVGSVPLLPVLDAADVAPTVAVAIAGGAVTASLALFLAGPIAGRRTAVRLGLVDGQILIGTESTPDVVRPLADLTGVHLSTETSAETRIDPAARDLRIGGIHHVRLTFADAAVYRVAVREADPVAAEIVRRLRGAIPAGDEQSVEQPSAADEIPDGPAPVADSAGEPRVAEASGIEPSISPAADLRLWEAARSVHRSILSEYGAYELDPTRYLRYPGVTDVTREPVMDFHTALAEAQALATDTYPDDPAYAGRYRAVVDTLRRTWIRCERDGKATGTEYLPEDDRNDLATAAKLYNHAQATDHAEEKTSYLRKVHRIVTDLDARGRVHLPLPVVAAIENQVRLALEPGRSGE